MMITTNESTVQMNALLFNAFFFNLISTYHEAFQKMVERPWIHFHSMVILSNFDQSRSLLSILEWLH